MIYSSGKKSRGVSLSYVRLFLLHSARMHDTFISRGCYEREYISAALAFYFTRGVRNGDGKNGIFARKGVCVRYFVSANVVVALWYRN